MWWAIRSRYVRYNDLLLRRKCPWNCVRENECAHCRARQFGGRHAGACVALIAASKPAQRPRNLRARHYESHSARKFVQIFHRYYWVTGYAFRYSYLGKKYYIQVTMLQTHPWVKCCGVEPVPDSRCGNTFRMLFTVNQNILSRFKINLCAIERGQERSLTCQMTCVNRSDSSDSDCALLRWVRKIVI